MINCSALPQCLKLAWTTRKGQLPFCIFRWFTIEPKSYLFSKPCILHLIFFSYFYRHLHQNLVKINFLFFSCRKIQYSGGWLRSYGKSNILNVFKKITAFLFNSPQYLHSLSNFKFCVRTLWHWTCHKEICSKLLLLA